MGTALYSEKKMRSSVDQIVDVLNGWKDAERVVAVLLFADKWGASLKWRGVVVEANRVRLLFFGEGVEVGVYLSSATTFEWQDPREAPPELRAESSETFDAFLEIRAPEYRCLLAAFRRPDERDLDTSVSTP